ncbi:hypothetical protein ACL9RL_07130 [Plantibacter sp. Mn2098]|uniref:hypothetical protein n=1 Tax=Plantibacter sp. Mn2098 TaxID=3395266 RepID=UPI003BDB22C0
MFAVIVWCRDPLRAVQRRLRRIVPARVREERGDVPGWVLITLMTAALVILIWGLAGPALSKLFEQAIDKVGKVG